PELTISAMLEQVRGATIDAEASPRVLLGLVEDDVVVDPGLGPACLLAVGAEDGGGRVGVGSGERLGLAAEVTPRAPDKVGERAAADLGLELAAAGEGLVEAGGERAEDVPVGAGLGLFENALQGAPRAPPEGDARDHLEQHIALERAVTLPEGEED